MKKFLFVLVALFTFTTVIYASFPVNVEIAQRARKKMVSSAAIIIKVIDEIISFEIIVDTSDSIFLDLLIEIHFFS